jgi:hypothetical protein
MKLKQILKEMNLNLEMDSRLGYNDTFAATEKDLSDFFSKMTPEQKRDEKYLYTNLYDYFLDFKVDIGDAHDSAAKSAAVKYGIDPRIIVKIIAKLSQRSAI